ncbi:cellulase N-terminal Ig-like domain-containing protein [Pedobacter agri]|uniref:cellulase N-terminal Ig-like domain-containing protein n=1 Tax=Pedobacter agri TaxID=454586 RepID=UPI00277F7637|nr:cellulase N-terminal Ig-like domain-containing protein [Pedobacter agri]MDQ1140863.1 hypothetical protein [Pedobacter agri]
MVKHLLSILLISLACLFGSLKSFENEQQQSWIRINLLGYPAHGSKVAVWASKVDKVPVLFELIDEQTKKVVYTLLNIKPFGAYGPFKQTARIITFQALKDLEDFTLKPMVFYHQ